MNTSIESKEQSRVSFKSLGLQKTFLKNIEKKGYKEPTDIQVQAIPEVLTGKDLIAIIIRGIPILSAAFQHNRQSDKLGSQNHCGVFMLLMCVAALSSWATTGLRVIIFVERSKEAAWVVCLCPPQVGWAAFAGPPLASGG